MDELISRRATIKYLMDNMTWYSEDGYETDEDEKKSAITSLINGVPSIQPVTNIENIPYLMHKEMDIPISECQKAYNIAMEYLRNKSKLKG